MRTIFCTSIFWIAAIAISYGYVITKQILIIPNHAGYVEVRQNSMVATPDSMVVHHRANSLDDLVKKVIEEN